MTERVDFIRTNAKLDGLSVDAHDIERDLMPIKRNKLVAADNFIHGGINPLDDTFAEFHWDGCIDLMIG